jgi:hypothetical protein
MSSTAVPAGVSQPSGKKSRRSGSETQGRAGWIIAIIAALFFSISVWAGISNLLYTITTYGTGLTGVAWFVTIGAIAVPIVVYGLSFLTAWKLGRSSKAVVFLVGITVTAVLTMNLHGILLRAIVG